MSVSSAMTLTGLTAPMIRALNVTDACHGHVTLGHNTRAQSRTVSAPALEVLEAKGMVERVEQDGRDRFLVTGAGKAAIAAWEKELRR